MTIESKQEQRIIYLAGGCFWGLEAYMERIQGVTDSVSGYANGKGDTTNYQLLHATDHAETVKVTYDPNKISLDKLLQYYFRCLLYTSVFDFQPHFHLPQSDKLIRHNDLAQRQKPKKGKACK